MSKCDAVRPVIARVTFGLWLPALLCGCFVAVPAVAQEDDDLPAVTYPALPTAGSGPADFAPKGWVVEAEVEGDLNKDGVADLVFVLHDTASANVVTVQEGLPALDTNPRILAAAFAQASGGYRLALENHTLIPRSASATVDDPFEDKGLELAKGSFAVSLGFFASAGAWEMSNTKLTMRYQNGRFELIGFDRNTTMRNSGETTDVSVNYSTGRVEIRKGTIESDASKLSVKKLPHRAAPTIDQVGSGLEFDPLG